MMDKEQAIAFYDSEAWKDLNSRERAMLQLNEELLCMPFSVFHEAIESALGRPVFVHEFASANSARLLDELRGVPTRN